MKLIICFVAPWQGIKRSGLKFWLYHARFSRNGFGLGLLGFSIYGGPFDSRLHYIKISVNV